MVVASLHDKRSLCDVILGDFANDHVMPFLEIWDVVHMEALSASMCAAARSRSVLWAGAGKLLRRFELSPALASRSLSLESRSLVAELQQATVCSPSIMGLADLTMVEALASAHRKAKVRAEAHLDAGGKVAEVFMTSFRFPHLTGDVANSAAAAPRTSDVPGYLWVPGASGMPGWLGLYISDPVGLSLRARASPSQPSRPETLAASVSEPSMATASCAIAESLSSSDPIPPISATTAPRATVPMAARADSTLESEQIWESLDLRLAWLRGNMLVSAQTRWPPPPPQRPPPPQTAAVRRGELLEALPSSAAPPMTGGPTVPQAGTGPGTFLVPAGAGPVGGAARSSGQSSSCRLIVDVRAVCPELFLCMRGTQVDVDGGWVKGPGVCSTTRGQAAAARTLAEGLPCVVFVRDCSETVEAAPPLLSSTVRALQLEVSRLYHVWT